MQKKCCSLGVATTTTYYIRFCNWALTSNTIFHQFHITVVVACLHIHFSRRLHSLSFGFNFGFRSSFRFSVVFPRTLSLFLPKCVACFFLFRSILHNILWLLQVLAPNVASSVAVCSFYLSHILPPSFFGYMCFRPPRDCCMMMSHVCEANQKKQNQNETKRKKREKQMNNHK